MSIELDINLTSFLIISDGIRFNTIYMIANKVVIQYSYLLNNLWKIYRCNLILFYLLKNLSKQE